MKKNQKYPRNTSLEALRGIAAVAVLLWHCQLAGFMFSGIDSFFASDFSRMINPLYIFMNGTSAVILFFVLSGYVLTRSYFHSNNMEALVIGAAKRWPRLMLPVLLSILISFFLYKLGFYFFKEAADLTNSQWMLRHSLFFIENSKFEKNFINALMQGAFDVFYSNNKESSFYYNTAMWTIKTEFFGSLLALFSAFFIKKYKNNKYSFVFAFLFFHLFCFFDFFKLSIPMCLIALPAGTWLAAYLPQKPILSRREAMSILFLGIFILHFFAFSVIGNHFFALIPGSIKVYPSIVGAMFIISAIEGYEPFKRNLSGKFWQLLGAFSFPIYLMHMLVIGSIGSWMLVYYGKTSALITTLVVTPIAAYPMLVFDKWWVKWVNRLTLLCFNAVKNKFVASSEYKLQGTLPLLPNQAA